MKDFNLGKFVPVSTDGCPLAVDGKLICLGSCNKTNKSEYRTKTGQKSQEVPAGNPGQLTIGKTVGLTEEYCKSTSKLQRDETKPKMAIYMDGPSMSVQELNQFLFSNEKSSKGKLVLRSLFTRDFQKGRSEKKSDKEINMKTEDDKKKGNVNSPKPKKVNTEKSSKKPSKEVQGQTSAEKRKGKGDQKPIGKNCKKHKVYVPILKNELVAEEITCQRKSMKQTKKAKVRLKCFFGLQ